MNLRFVRLGQQPFATVIKGWTLGPWNLPQPWILFIVHFRDLYSILVFSIISCRIVLVSLCLFACVVLRPPRLLEKWQSFGVPCVGTLHAPQKSMDVWTRLVRIIREVYSAHKPQVSCMISQEGLCSTNHRVLPLCSSLLSATYVQKVVQRKSH